MTALAKTTGNGAMAHPDAGALLERVVIEGDLSILSSSERVQYYQRVCESVGLNPLTKPFDYIKLNGKLTLYAKRDATDQLRKIHRVSITIKARETIEGVYVVTASARTHDGREDEATGAVPIAGLKGDNLANAMMKAETKAKRRVTLSICGLGWLDETEVETIPSAQTMDAALEGSREQYQAIAEEQTKQRLESDHTANTWLRELLAPIAGKAKEYEETGDVEAKEQAEEALFRWIRLHAWEWQNMHTNARSRVYRGVKKIADALQISAADIKSCWQDHAIPPEDADEQEGGE